MATPQTTDPTTRYLPTLLAGPPQALLDLFTGSPTIDDPRAGHITGREAVAAFAADTYAWLHAHTASVEPVRTTHGAGRTVAEAVLHLTLDGQPVALPVAVVGEPEGDGLRAVRVYHSFWPLLGAHRVRPPLLAHDPDLQLPDVIERYQQALAGGDLAAALSAFEPDGVAREPSGGPHIYRGDAGLRAFYGGLFAGGGIPLEHCTLTDDGVCCAIEYNVVRWGARRLPRQAGIACYERGPHNLLAAARIYDDVAIEAGVA